MANVYSNLKIFHFPQKMAGLSPGSYTLDPPLHLRIKPTNFCNHNCGYCAYRMRNLQLGKNMRIKDFIPKGKILEIIDDAIEMGIKAITFSGGGEPFCYPYLTTVLKKIARSSIKFASLTNGSLLCGEAAEIFAHHGTWIRVSLDGWDPESYATYRGVDTNSFNRLLENLTEFKKLGGRCRLGVSVIVDHHNAPRLAYLVGLLKGLGVDSVKVSPCIVSNRGEENREYHQVIFSEVRSQVAEVKALLEDHNFEIFDAYHELEEKFEKKYTWCPYIQILPVIGADQNIYSCQDKAYNLENGLLGSIKGKRFKEFWYESKERFFQINPRQHCRHHCVAHGKNEMIHSYLNSDPEHLPFV